MNAVDVQEAILGYLCLLFSLSMHEAAHALTADWCGDPSPRLMGRVTLNPLAHIDPIGTVLLPLFMTFYHVGYLLGWAKPVPFNPVNLRNMRRDPVLIAVAGPLSNLLIAAVAAIALRLVVMFMGVDVLFGGSPVTFILHYLIELNLLLMLFNILPVPPLDGHYVLHYFLPPGGQRVLDSIGPFGILIALVLINRTPVLSGPLVVLQSAVDQFLLWGAK